MDAATLAPPSLRDPTFHDEVTALLGAWRCGDDDALAQLLEAVFDHLRRIAQRHMSRERKDHTLQPTALVHEAFLRLIDNRVEWQDRGHFFAVSTRLMRRILVDHARAAGRSKRGGEDVRIPLYEAEGEGDGSQRPVDAIDLVDLDRALHALEKVSLQGCRALELCYLAGLSYPEIADALQTSRATVGRELRFARAWVRHYLSPAGGTP